MGVEGSTGRLIELGKRQRRAQFEAARPLTLSNGHGGPQGIFRERRIRGVALQQHVAADATQFRFERAIAGATARG